MNIEKIEELIKLMKQNQVNYMKYKDETVEVELDLKSTSNIVTTTPVNNVGSKHANFKTRRTAQYN
ncbi:hypothetical protein NIT60_12025 [Mammaliicoccus sciuri]|nr:hypothetical protein NIT60_12025 [Mammaliicoccus sciuri]